MRHDRLVHAILDVGGTAIKTGAVAGSSAVAADPVPTHAHGSPTEIIERLQQAIDTSISCAVEHFGVEAAGVGIAFPGPFDLAGGRPLLSGQGKFDSVHGVDLRALLDTAGRPIEFARDSEAVGVGEARFGAGRRHRRVLTIALGTGVGSCLTENGSPIRVLDGQVVESLHQLETPHGRVDDVLSANGLADQLGIDPTDLGPLLSGRTASATQHAALRRYARRLGGFIATLDHFDADLVVIAGGLAGSFDLLRDELVTRTTTPVVAAGLGSHGALLGTALLAFATNR